MVPLFLLFEENKKKCKDYYFSIGNLWYQMLATRWASRPTTLQKSKADEQRRQLLAYQLFHPRALPVYLRIHYMSLYIVSQHWVPMDR